MFQHAHMQIISDNNSEKWRNISQL